jgi:hypothetical protein
LITMGICGFLVAKDTIIRPHLVRFFSLNIETHIVFSQQDS